MDNIADELKNEAFDRYCEKFGITSESDTLYDWFVFSLGWDAAMDIVALGLREEALLRAPMTVAH